MARHSSPSLWTSWRHRLEYSAMRLLAMVLRMMGIDAASAAMGWIWQKIAPLTRRQDRVIRNLRNAYPDLTEDEIRATAADQWNNLGRTFAESVMIDRFLSDPERISLDADILDKVSGSDAGFVLVSLHTGNWELVSVPIAERFELAALYQKLSNPMADRYVRAMREKIYRSGLLPKSFKTPKTVMQMVRSGRGVAMLADHREKKGVEITFFGQPAQANPFPALIARRLGVPLIAGRSVRLNGANFRVEGIEIEISATDDASADVEAATKAIQRQFETWIREYPGQWMWVHDRWRPGRPRRKGQRQTLDKSGVNAN